MSLWDSLRGVAQKAGEAAMIAGHKTRLQGEILLVDREIKGRKQQFGVELYDHVGPLAKSPDFFAGDDPLTAALRPSLLTAQREIAAMEIKRGKTKEAIAQAEIKRRAAFPEPAVTFVDKVKNAGVSTTLAANEAKLATDLSVVEGNIKYEKQKFGEEMFEIFVKLEDEKGWLPTDRNVRSMYDKARQDVEKLIKKRADKIAELEKLGGTYRFEKKPGEESKEGNTTNGDSMTYSAPTAPATPFAAPVAPPPPQAVASQLSTRDQGMFSYPGQPIAPQTTPDPFAVQSDFMIAAAPMGGPTNTITPNYQAPVAPISQTGSYMQSSMRVSQAPPVASGYMDSPSMDAPMGGYGSMNGYMGSTPMGAPMGGSAGSSMGGSAPSGDFMGGFADFGVGGFPQQQHQPPPPLPQSNHNAFGQGYSDSVFGNSSGVPHSGTSNQQNTSQQSNDLFLF